MILLYGYSLLYIISGIFSYEIKIWQMLLIAVFCYFIDRFAFKTLRRTLTIILSIIITISAMVYILYKMELLSLWLGKIRDYMMVYYLSLTVETVAIGFFHQLLILILVGIILMRLLQTVMAKGGKYYYYVQVGAILLVLGGFLMKTLGAKGDQTAYLFLTTSMIIYFFYNFYQETTDHRRGFLPLLTTAAIFILVVIVGARTMYEMDPRPLTTEVRKGQFQLSDDVQTQVSQQDKLSYYKHDEYPIDDKFEFIGIEILKIRTIYTRYLKADTFEIYNAGKWEKIESLPYLPEDGDAIHKSTMFDPVDYLTYYKLDSNRVVMKNVTTNLLLVNNYAQSRTMFYGNLRVMYDPRRGIYFTNDVLDPEYVYMFEGVTPTYGSGAFTEFVRKYANEPRPQVLDPLAVLPEGYQQVEALAKSITKGLTNPYDQALAIERYLKLNYTYNELPDVSGRGPSEDPILYFLFENREGFCQHFTSAFALMTRSLGMPTRYATGFYVDHVEQDREDVYGDFVPEDYVLDGFYSVKDSNAHTWPEIYFPEVGWIMFEPTPGMIYQEVQVDGFDLDYEALEDLPQETDGLTFSWKYVIVFFSSVLMLLIAYLVYRLIRFRFLLGKKADNVKWLSIYRILQRYLGLCGLKREASETHREFAGKVDYYLFDQKGIKYSELVHVYEQLIYGQLEVTRDQMEITIAYYETFKGNMKYRLNRFLVLYMWFYEYFVYKP